MRYLTLVPAYGRDYTSKAAVLADWNDGKDFLIQDYRAGGYINKRDAINEGVSDVNIRYAKNRKVVPVKVKP